MKRWMRMLLYVAVVAVCLGTVSARGQQAAATPVPATTAAHQPAPGKHGRSAAGDIGSGTGDIGKGVAKGAGSAAKGAGKGAVDLVTLHPIDAAGDVGKGAVGAGAHVAVGAGKGSAKIAKGTGKAIRKLF